MVDSLPIKSLVLREFLESERIQIFRAIKQSLLIHDIIRIIPKTECRSNDEERTFIKIMSFATSKRFCGTGKELFFMYCSLAIGKTRIVPLPLPYYRSLGRIRITHAFVQVLRDFSSLNKSLVSWRRHHLSKCVLPKSIDVG